MVENKTQTTNAESASANKTESKKIEVKKETSAKDVAVVNAFSAAISTKHSVAICKMIMRKSPDQAIEMLEKVLKKTLAVPMLQAEIPHRRRALIPGPRGGGGRFPMNASKEFVKLLSQLKANCEVNGVENPIITLAVPNLASRPFRKQGRRAKRTNIHIEARDKLKLGAKK